MFANTPGRVSRPNEQDAWLYVDEISHRTINDYAVVLATLRLASSTLTDSDSQRVLDEVADRLRATAATYRALRPPFENAPRRLDEELDRLCSALCASSLAGRSINLTLFCEPVELSAQGCWKACLVVSELVTNAMRHAFTDTQEGEISVDVRRTSGHVCCRVSDNGRADDVVRAGRGTRIVRALVSDLGGEIRSDYGRTGSVAVLMFPVGENPATETAVG